MVSATGITNAPSATVTYTYASQANGQLYTDITDTKDGVSRTNRQVHEFDTDEADGAYHGTLLQVVTDVGGLNDIETWTYDSNRRMTQHCDSFDNEPGGKNQTGHYYYTYYPPDRRAGLVTKYIDPENYDVGQGFYGPGYVYGHDTRGNKTGEWTPEGRVTGWTYYSGTDRPYQVIVHDTDINGNPVDRITTYTYYPGTDPAYRRYKLYTMTDARSNVTTYYYDSATGYLDYVDLPGGNVPPAKDVDYTYNAVGDATAVTDGNGITTSYQYDGIHRQTQITYPDVGAGQKTKITDYTCCGVDQVTDENGRITKYEYYAYTNRLWKVHEDYTGLNYITTYTYDEVGNLKTETNARGKVTTYWYDDANRKTQADYPDGTHEYWSYRDDGRMYTHTDGRGRVITYRYDADDRLAGSGSYVAINNPNDADVQIVRDKDGLITSFTDGTGTTTNAYYPSNLLWIQTNGAGKTVTLEYNGVGKVSSVTAPGVGATTYAYNALNQVTSVTNALGLSSTFAYYPNDSKLFRIYRPGSYIQYEYNARNWLIRVVNGTWPGDQVIYNVLYNVWDNVGNPLLKVEWFPGDLRYATTFTYDGVYRLTLESRNRCCLGGDPYTASYTYDQVGNRLSLTLNGTVTNYTYDDNDKLLTATSGGNSAGFGYDGAGNMLSVTGNLFGARTMVYDDASRLTSTTFPGGTDMFTYNGFGQKMGATLEGIARTYAWFGDRLIAEYGCGGCCYAGAIYTDGSYGGLWLGRQMGGQKQYPVYDSIGSVRRVVNETGTVVFSNDLDAFGHAIAGSGSATWHPYRFGGAWGYTTMPSGLEQLGARFYWPEVGRFVSQDPARDDVNWYAYVKNNPQTGVDPNGEFVFVLVAFYSVYKGVSTGMAVANTVAAGYLAIESLRCLNTSTTMVRQARRKLPNDRFEEWKHAARPGTECAELVADAGWRLMQAGGWAFGRIAPYAIRNRPPWMY